MPPQANFWIILGITFNLVGGLFNLIRASVYAEKFGPITLLLLAGATLNLGLAIWLLLKLFGI